MNIRLLDARPEIILHWERVKPGNLSAKRHFSELLFLMAASREIVLADTWDEAEKYVKKLNVVKSDVFYNLFAEVWENLNKDNYWEIDDTFIHNLGSDYLSLLVLRHMKNE